MLAVALLLPSADAAAVLIEDYGPHWGIRLNTSGELWVRGAAGPGYALAETNIQDGTVAWAEAFSNMEIHASLKPGESLPESAPALETLMIPIEIAYLLVGEVDIDGSGGNFGHFKAEIIGSTFVESSRFNGYHKLVQTGVIDAFTNVVNPYGIGFRARVDGYGVDTATRHHVFAYADPVVTIDPSWEFAGLFDLSLVGVESEVTRSSGTPPSTLANVAEPPTVPSLAIALALLGVSGRRWRRAPGSGVA